MRDLTDPRWIKLKGLLFLCLGTIASGLILLETGSLRLASLLLIAVWAFCRAYYFAFYVIEKYVDPSFRFSGLGAAARYLMRAGARNPTA
jgi:hypothetical protein